MCVGKGLTALAKEWKFGVKPQGFNESTYQCSLVISFFNNLQVHFFLKQFGVHTGYQYKNIGS